MFALLRILMVAEDVYELFLLVLGKELRHIAHGTCLTCLVEQVNAFRQSGVGLFCTVAELVQSLTVIDIVHLSHGFHAAVYVVVEQGKTVVAFVEVTPSAVAQILCLVDNVLCRLEDMRASHGGKSVHVHTYDDMGIVCQQGHELVVQIVWVVFQLVGRVELEVEVLVAGVVKRSRVDASPYWTVAGEKQCALIGTVLCFVFVHGDVEVAFYALHLFIPDCGPLFSVEEFLHLLPQRLACLGVGVLQFGGVYGHLGIEFLCRRKGWQKVGKQYQDVLFHDKNLLIISRAMSFLLCNGRDS